MVESHNHVFEEKRATLERPYHYVDTGLPNVYLAGIKYRKCKACGMQSADIPAVKHLMIALGRAVVEKNASLSGAEIRFLRKRLAKKASEFARVIGVTDEEISRWENGHFQPSRSADKLIRVYYCVLSKDRGLKDKVDKHIEAWLSALPGEGHTIDIRAKLWRQEWTAALLPS
jgi:putative transcriptional regulator